MEKSIFNVVTRSLSLTVKQYTNMINGKAKLTGLANFGASGKVNHQLIITNGFGNIGSITSVSQLNAYNIIYIDMYIRNGAIDAFSSTEINALLSWSYSRAKVLMIQEQATYGS